MRVACLLPALLIAVLIPAGPAGAVTVDGTLDPEYGPPLTVQVNGYAYGSEAPRGNYCDHTELDALHAFVSPDSVLHVFLTGNLRDWIGSSEPSPNYDFLFLLLDTQAGGQPAIRSDDPTPLAGQAGLAFDSGFAPDWAFVATEPQLCCLPPARLDAYYAALTSGGGTGYLLGSNYGQAPGTLASGTNPYDVHVALDNSALGAIPHPCGTGSGLGVTTGVEWAIPLAAIGLPAGCIRLMAYASHNFPNLENQVLPPVPAGTCLLGVPSSVDFAALAGEQFVSLCDWGVPARTPTWGALKAIYR